MQAPYFLTKYYFLNKLGSGGFGNVYRVVDIIDGKEYALKIIKPSNEGKTSFQNEVQAHLLLSSDMTDRGCSDYVVCLHDSGFYDPVDAPPNFADQINDIANAKGYRTGTLYPYPVYYLLETLMDGDLKDIAEHNREYNDIPEDSLLQIILKLLEGLASIHDQGIAHRDIKLENLMYFNRLLTDGVKTHDLLKDPKLVEKDFVVQYGDLGFTCGIEEQIRECGANATIIYISPETKVFIQNKESLTPEQIRNFSMKSDAWALGIAIMTMITGEHPILPKVKDLEVYDILSMLDSYTSMSYEDIFPEIYRGDNEKLDAIINTILKALLEPNPGKRIPVRDIIQFIKTEYPEIYNPVDLGEITL